MVDIGNRKRMHTRHTRVRSGGWGGSGNSSAYHIVQAQCLQIVRDAVANELGFSVLDTELGGDEKVFALYI